MNQRYEGSPCGIPRGVYTAKPNLPGLGLRRLLFFKLTLMVLVGVVPIPTALLTTIRAAFAQRLQYFAPSQRRLAIA